MGKAEKNKILSNMKNLLNETGSKVEKEVREVNQIKKEEVEGILAVQVFKELTADEKILNLLVNSSIELFQIQAKNAIELGKVFKNVFDELGGEGSKYTGLYEKWLSINNVSKSTALRYRKRYELYSSVIPSKQSVVNLLAQKYIDIIFLEENRPTYIDLINKGAAVKEIIEFIESETAAEVKVIEHKKKEYVFNYTPRYLNFSNQVNEKIESLDEKKKKELQKYLKKIDDLLNDVI